MGKTVTPLAKALQDALDAEAMALARFNLATEELEKARGALSEASVKVREARVCADTELPPCVLHKKLWGASGDSVTTEAAVIVKRTSKEVQVRRVGQPTVLRFRLKTSSGRWERYPADPSMFSGTTWLTF